MGGKNFIYVIWLTLAYLNQCADNIAHHMMQKRARRKLKHHFVTDAFYATHVQCFNRAFRLALGGAKAGKIMMSQQFFGRTAHRADIQFARHPPYAAGV